LCGARRHDDNVSQLPLLVFMAMVVTSLCVSCVVAGWIAHEARDRRDPQNRWQGRFVDPNPPRLYDQDDDQ